jgi:phosphoribosylformylglycinamidine synthase
MLVVAKAGHEQDVRRILEKWQLRGAVIGQVTDDGCYRVRDRGAVVCEVPGQLLVTGCPTCVREARESDEVRRLRSWRPESADHSRAAADPAGVLLQLLASPSIASKRWVYNQYQTAVRADTVIGPGGDAGVIRIPGTSKGIAATVNCNGRYVYLNPRRGARIAVAEAARNLVCVGARPRAVTNALNFGDPHRPEVYHQLREAVLGMGEACAAFDTPVTGGSVSLYNQNPRGAIYPTPVVGMVGVLEDVSRHVPATFRQAGDAVILLGRNTAELGASEYLQVVHAVAAGNPPAVDLRAEKALQETMLELAWERLPHSAHDCAEGGLAVCLAESAMAGESRIGVRAVVEDELLAAAAFFGEAQGRIVLSCAARAAARVLDIADQHGVPARVLGEVGGDRFELRGGGTLMDVPVDVLAHAWHEAIPRLMQQDGRD